MEGLAMHQAKILLQQGFSRKTVADILDVSRRTVYNYEHSRVFTRSNGRGRPKGTSKLLGFCDYIVCALQQDFTLNAEVLFEKLRLRGYDGRISILRDFIRRTRSRMRNEAVLRFETLPGQQAQVDWMHAGVVWVNGMLRKRYAFVMKLGYSRRSYVEFTLSMEQPVLFMCMSHAFDYFGGVVAEVLFDNMKTAFLFDKENQRWYAHPRMAALAAHCGFAPRRCRVYRPKTKGKVEREVRYLRYSFLPSVSSDISRVSNEQLNELAGLWLERVDGKLMRDLGATRLQRFAEDAKALRPLPTKHFEYRLMEPIFVTKEGMFTFQGNHYSAPGGFCGSHIEGLFDPAANTLTLRANGRDVRSVRLVPANAGNKVTLPEDRAAHLQAWREGVEAEERRRLQALARRRRAEQENTVGDPAVYDLIVAREQLILEEVVS